MTKDDWAKLRFFKETENWGDPERMSPILLKALDDYRSVIKTPILVTSGTNGEHASESEHYVGRAVDIMFPELLPADLFDMYLIAERFPFSGIGVYPSWKLNGVIRGGLHLDVRPYGQGRWMGVLDENKKQVYVGLNKINLKNQGLI